MPVGGVQIVPVHGTLTDKWTFVEGGSRRGKDILIGPGGYSYTVNRRNKESTNWRGSRRDCKGSVTQNAETFTAKGEHNHDGN